MFLHIRKGITFWWKAPDSSKNHFYVMLTGKMLDEDENREKIEKVLVVNISSVEGKRDPDLTLVLTSEDHDEIEEESFVAYQYAEAISVDELDKEKSRGKLHTKDSMKEAVVNKIIDGLENSPQTPDEAIEFYKLYLKN